MKRYALIILLASLVMALLSCQQVEEIPTAAPVATVPVPPTVTLIPMTPTPDYLEPRHRDSVIVAKDPIIARVNTSSDTVSSQNPAYLDLEITSMHPLSLTLEVSRIEDDGRVLLIDRPPISPGDGASESSSVISPGIQEQLLTWDALGYYLSDGTAGGFVFVEDTEPGQSRVRGLHRPSGSDEDTEAYLLFDKDVGILTGVSDARNGEPLTYLPGDSFQTEIYYLEGGDDYITETGTALFINEYGVLYLQNLPLPDGHYQLDYRFLSPAGKPFHIFEQFEVDNSGIEPGKKTYFDPVHGLQFRLPNDWSTPEYSEGVLTTQDSEGSFKLTLVSQPSEPSKTPGELRAQVLDAYGDVHMLYAEPVVIGDIATSWTAYGYESQDGPVTGVFLAFAKGGWAHVIDIEGQNTEDEILLDTAGSIIRSLELRPVSREEHPGMWQETPIDGYVVSTDGSFLRDQTDTKWDRFVAKDGSSFIAFRVLEQGIGMNNDLRSLLLGDITGPIPDVTLSEQYGLTLGSNQWNRIDFTYGGSDGEPRLGFLMRSAGPSSELLVWAESTPENYDSLERETFFPMLADITEIGSH